MSLGTILLIVVILILLGVLPTWPVPAAGATVLAESSGS
jgi:hypothetical protein